jgi:predicted metalloprotease with PDZ domain
MQDDLLWVYEGMTQYWGIILNERAGLERPEATRDSLAGTAANLDHRPGRNWRSLQDTADSSSFIRGTGREYDNLRRAQDYYVEGVFVWLEADTVIRQRTAGKKSLDDFCRAFYGPPSTGPEVKTYTFADVVRGLNAVTPYDWAGFLRARLDAVGGGAPLGGLTNSGWKLVYTDTPGPARGGPNAPARPGRGAGAGGEAATRPPDFRYSLGFSLDADGVITDINPTMPAFQSGLGPGIKVVAVGDQAYTPDVLRAALKAAVTDPKPLSLLTTYGTTYHTYTVDYHGGERYPHLERDPSKPDLLSAIFQPRAAPAPSSSDTLPATDGGKD